MTESSEIGSLPFIWPVHAQGVRFFGSKDGGVDLRGIVIDSERSDQVKAARDGKVVFTDKGLRGYGSTIIIDHAEEFSTVYAGNFDILVTPGHRVRQGDLIGKIMAADKAVVPTLYFEIRKNGRAEDPMSYLRDSKTSNPI